MPGTSSSAIVIGAGPTGLDPLRSPTAQSRQGQGSQQVDKKAEFVVGAFLLVAGFVWIVFDNLALGLIFGLIAGGTAAARAQAKDREP